MSEPSPTLPLADRDLSAHFVLRRTFPEVNKYVLATFQRYKSISFIPEELNTFTVAGEECIFFSLNYAYDSYNVQYPYAEEEFIGFLEAHQFNVVRISPDFTFAYVALVKDSGLIKRHQTRPPSKHKALDRCNNHPRLL